jgi:hypothetical protein
MSSIDVLFVAASPFQLQIKHTMKTLATIQDKPAMPSLFQIAARIEIPALPRVFRFSLIPGKNPSQADANKAVGQRGFYSTNNDDAHNNKPAKDIKTVEFHLKAPFAESVKLAADFTDWEKFPLDMIKSEDGIWYTMVPLPSGNYAYRFIVDGEWWDDPNSLLRVHNNPSGIANAMVKVA